MHSGKKEAIPSVSNCRSNKDKCFLSLFSRGDWSPRGRDTAPFRHLLLDEMPLCCIQRVQLLSRQQIYDRST
ncbi:hypothetical protein CEXT_257191 [Caerostris extrusa]|uniref:Uncharacterized protein n=1 Tax=Caerostris extrusa TaxID=172846 RepID=A0AAV4T5U8_CAEEX|nr:hypothetical protein CEXT_257191 [Caerostris extrusa]